MIMVVVMTMTVGMIVVMGMIVMVNRLGFTGTANFYRIGSVAASACVTHNYSFCSTSKDFNCSSVPRISLMPCLLHSGQWLNILSGV